jgi:hypothetical protein
MESPQIIHVALVCPGAPRKIRHQSMSDNTTITNSEVRRKLSFNQ